MDELVRTFIAVDFTKPGDNEILRDAIKQYIVAQIDVLKNSCVGTYMDWNEKVAQKIERAISLYKGITQYTTTTKIDDSNAVIRKL